MSPADHRPGAPVRLERWSAEGIEDEATLQALRHSGCDIAQGYLFGKALSAAAMESWLSEAGRGVH